MTSSIETLEQYQIVSLQAQTSCNSSSRILLDYFFL